MSDVQDSTTAAAPTAVEQPTTTPMTTELSSAGEAPAAVEPANQDTIETTAAPEDTPVPTTETFESQAADPVDKKIEPITEGQLSYKGPGLIKSLIPSKKEFWLTDAVEPQLDLSSFIRGEKPDHAIPVAAWASQTSKGLLFFNKKGDHNRLRPDTVLPLYEATDLRKQAPHEITFFIKPHHYTLKAATDAERDGWYMSIEKAMELGKASKDSIESSEGYKTKLAELNKPQISTPPVTPSAASAKKSSEVNKADENQPPKPEEKQAKKSRSTSRGVLDRLRNKKDETEQKKEERKDVAKEEAKTDHETETAAAAAAGAAAVVGGAVVAGEEERKPTADEGASAQETKTEDKPKPAKRTSIFGGFFKGQQKEKEHKDVEPAADVKDGVVVAENPPQLPEAATATDKVEESATTEAPGAAITANEEPKPEAEMKAEEPKDEAVTPNKEKKNFLSNFGFKRGRSASPSAPHKETQVKDEVAPEEPTEASKGAEEPIGETGVPAVIPVAVPAETTMGDEKPEEAPKAETPTTTKRQSIISSFGRRASQAFKGKSTPKKDASAPKAAEEAHATTAETAPTEQHVATSEPAEPTGTQPQVHIGDVVPEAVHVGEAPNATPTVATASA